MLLEPAHFATVCDVLFDSLAANSLASSWFEGVNALGKPLGVSAAATVGTDGALPLLPPSSCLVAEESVASAADSACAGGVHPRHPITSTTKTQLLWAFVHVPLPTGSTLAIVTSALCCIDMRPHLRTRCGCCCFDCRSLIGASMRGSNDAIGKMNEWSPRTSKSY